MKQKEYNIAMIDTTDACDVLEALNKYGENGYTFVGWVDGPPVTSTNVNIKYAILVKDSKKDVKEL
jgi:hypothetical protein